jgi:hypothetical protein
MNNETQLVIPLNRKTVLLGLTFVLVTLALMAFLLISFDDIRMCYSATFLGNLVSFLRLSLFIELLVKSFLYVGIGIFSFIFIYHLLFMGTMDPLAILNPKGIWVYDFGFIPWDNVETITRCLYPAGSNFEYVGIQLKDIVSARTQANWSGKLRLFWAKIFGYYHIMLSNAAVSNDEIVSVAQCYRHAYAQEPAHK